MKLLIIPKDIKLIDRYVSSGCHGLIVGLKDFCTGYDLTLSVDEIRSLCDRYPNLEIFVSMNKNFFNDELKMVESHLKELDDMRIKAVLFYDLSVLYIKRKKDLKIDLVWNQTHMVTNYNTCNYYHDLGVNYAFLSSEITLEEINEMSSKSDMKLMALAYGYPIIAHSRRTLLSNYFINRKKKYDGQVCHVSDDDNRFSIKEDASGTTFYNDEFLNGSCLITDSNIDYVILNDYLFDVDEAVELARLASELISTKDGKIVEKITSLIGDNTNFFFKKTIFMVKKNEK